MCGSFLIFCWIPIFPYRVHIVIYQVYRGRLNKKKQAISDSLFCAPIVQLKFLDKALCRSLQV